MAIMAIMALFIMSSAAKTKLCNDGHARSRSDVCFGSFSDLGPRACDVGLTAVGDRGPGRLAGAARRCHSCRQVRQQRPGKRASVTGEGTMNLAAKLFAALLALL